MQKYRRQEKLQYLKSIAKTEIFTIWELITFIILFLIFSYIFFPKGKIEKYISSPYDTNYQLSRVYLEKLLKIRFRPELVFLLVEREVKLGKYKEALKILNKYREILRNCGMYQQFLEEKYRILKADYTASRENHKNKKLKKEIEDILKELLQTEKQKEIMFVYREALELNLPELRLEAAEKLAELTGSKKWYREALNVAIALKNWKEAMKISGELIENNPKLLKEAIFIAKKSGEREKLKQFVLKIIRSGKFTYKDLETAIWIELSEKDYRGIEKICRVAIRRKPEEKIVLVCLKAALWTKNYTMARSIIKQNLKRFSKNPAILKAFLKTAVMINAPKLQVEVADQLLKLVEKGKR